MSASGDGVDGKVIAEAVSGGDTCTSDDTRNSSSGVAYEYPRFVWLPCMIRIEPKAAPPACVLSLFSRRICC